MFRFEELEIWKKGIEFSDGLLDLADSLSEKKLYRFAEQLRVRIKRNMCILTY